MSMLSPLQRSAEGRRQVLTGMLLRLIAQLCTVAPLFIAWLAIGDITPGAGSWSHWPQLLTALLACLLVQLLCSHVGQLWCFVGSYEVMQRYREAAAEQLRRLPLGYFQRHRLGATTQLLTDHMMRVEQIFSHLLPEVVTGIGTALIFVLILLAINVPLTLALIAPLPLAVLLLWGGSHFLLRGTHRQSERLLRVSGLLIEFIGGIKTLRLFHRHHGMLAKLDDAFGEIRRASMGLEAWGAGAVQLFRLFTELGLVVLFIVAGGLLQQQALDPLTWLLFILVSIKVLEPLLDAAAYFTLMSVMRQSQQRLDALMAEPVLNDENSVPLPENNAIHFTDVHFSYDRQPTIQGVSFAVPEGSVTALVGPSGSGKSTLLHLLGRFYEPQRGEISLGGVPLAQIGTRALYQRIGYVFQDVQLFDGSVLDNVRLGRPDASEADAIAACREACCDGFIQQLPQGYHTRLGEGAQRLSGGERQRLSIARMMLKDPPVILLDEVTALLDPLSQADIQQALTRLARGRTVLIIAHRLRTVEYASQILVMEHGQIVERGSHQQLLAQGGIYRRMWQEQE